LWVIRSVLQPILAEAAAASVPIREEIWYLVLHRKSILIPWKLLHQW
jgi:hypothetical protein